jgi:multiple sugar transport system permease protein
VSDTTLTREPGSSTQSSILGWFGGRRGRQLREAVTAYLFLLPALLIIGTFGLFPLAFSAYESTLTGLATFLGDYGGMENYTKAIGELAYVVAFWIAAVLAFLAVRSLADLARTAREGSDRPWLWSVPGIVTAAGLGLFARFFFVFLPEVLDIANKVKGEKVTTALFNQLLVEAWRAPAVQDALRRSLLVLVVGGVLAFLVGRFLVRSPRNGSHYVTFIVAFLLLMAAAVLTWFTWSEIQAAYAEALEDGEGLALWSQVVTISAGFLLLILSWWLWGSASRRPSNSGMFLRLGAAALLMIGAWVLIGELPRVIAAGDKDWWQGLVVTVYYSVGSIPFQLCISLVIAVLLFQNIRGRDLFRLVYFLPYITPTVAAAAAFRIFFSSRVTAPANSLLGLVGIGPQPWRDGPDGILMMLGDALGIAVPSWAAGPSMSMVVIIIFGIWTFVGWDVVIFLAGLGSISKELYEAASIDGAGRGAQFRHITLPLLSPTIYFITLWAVIGTFKAFTHIWVLRSRAALGTTDTASVVIFNEFKRNNRYGYASALAIVLLIIILILTTINNRIARERVFYG